LSLLQAVSYGWGAHDIRHGVDEDLAVANLARLRRLDNYPAHRVHLGPAQGQSMLGLFAQCAKPPWRCLQESNSKRHSGSATGSSKSRRSPEHNNVDAGLVDQGVRAVLCPAVALLLACRGAARQANLHTRQHSEDGHSTHAVRWQSGLAAYVCRRCCTSTPHDLSRCAPPCTPAPFTDDAVMPRMPLLLRARTTIGSRQGRMMACRTRVAVSFQRSAQPRAMLTAQAPSGSPRRGRTGCLGRQSYRRRWHQPPCPAFPCRSSLQAQSCQGLSVHIWTAANAGCRTRRTSCRCSCAAVPP